jgi:arabinan endo-1,5-alpha-L-arabinosidase
VRAAPAICYATYCLCSACTGHQDGGFGGAGGRADSGSAVGGQAGDSAGGVAFSGGTSGGIPDSAIGAGGTSGAGGAGQTGGSARSDGGLGGGGVDAGMGGRTGLDAGRSAGGGGGGGNTATGGITATGGLAGGKGGAAGSSDRCDVGVYDSASPPKVLSLTGSLGCHDPSAIAGDGTHYAFCTGLGSETSTNLTSWKSTGRPFAAPSWLTSTISGVGDLWAPDISQFGGKYHLYYAGSTFGSNKSCIGHATSDSMAGAAWTDDGAATICSNVGSKDDWNAIDPNVIVDTEGKPWLTLGSFWSGLKVIQLDDSGKRMGTTVTSIANRPNNGGALEAPFMVRRCGYYYLFMSWDTCCKGADSTYNIRVVRGTSVLGPFADKAGTAALQGGGTLIAEGNSSFAGPGGQSVMFTGEKAYLVYHAYAKPSGAITLRIAELVWDSDGWPLPVGP